MKPKVILYIAMSKDGYIAAEFDNLDFLNKYQIPDEDYGYTAFIKRVGCIIVGRKTYDKVINMGFPYHDDKLVFVLSREKIKSKKKNLIYFNDDVKVLIDTIQLEKEQIIYCDGGAQITHLFLKDDLIDEMIISVVPDLLGNGTLLFSKAEIPKQFVCKSIQKYKNGLTQYHYIKTLP